MAGIFSKANRPKLPGAYINFEAAKAALLPTSPGSAVAIAAVGDWGPTGTAIRCRSEAELRSIYGPSDNTDLYLAARQAFQGEGFDGLGGAGEVVVVRFNGVGAAAVKASKTINKAGGGAAITLKAKYPGTYGNNLSTEVIDGTTGLDILIVKLNGVDVERYTYAETNITNLAEQIAESDWVEASGVTSGTALDQSTDGALSGGTNGTVAAGDWTAAFASLENQPFAVFAAYKMTEISLHASLQAWVEEANAKGKRFFGVIGGARTSDTVAESINTALGRSGENANPNILNVDGVVLKDKINGPSTASGEVVVGGTELTARVAGILAARGEYASLTLARLADTEIIAGRSASEQLTAFEEGVVTFGRDSHAEAPVHIKSGLSTWTTVEATKALPYKTYRQPKYVRTMHGIETDLTTYVEQEILGRRPIDGPTRDAVVSEAKRILQDRERQGVIQPGWMVGIDQDPPPTEEDEFIALVIQLKFGRALEQVFFTISVS